MGGQPRTMTRELADFLEAPRCLRWAGTEQFSPAGAGVLGQPAQGPGKESDLARWPGHLGAATPNHRARGPAGDGLPSCPSWGTMGWSPTSGSMPGLPSPEAENQAPSAQASSQPEAVREVDMSSAQATGDYKQEAWLLAPARLQPASPRGLSSLLQPRWPTGIWPGLGTQCLLKK